MKRREFLTKSLLATAAIGLNLYSIPTFALDRRKEKIIYIFLRGGADFLSIFPPKLFPNALNCDSLIDYSRHPLFHYRGLSDSMCDSFLFGSSVCPFGDYKAGSPNAPIEVAGHPVLFHPGFRALEPVIRGDNLSVILHTGSFNESRSHFDQMDMIESGSDMRKFGTGYLARAASFLGSSRTPIAIGETIPRSLSGADAPLITSASDVGGLTSVAGGRVWAAHYAAGGEMVSGMDLQDRLDFLRSTDVNCENAVFCNTATQAKEMYARLDNDLKDYTPIASSNFVEACSLAAKLTTADFNPSIMTIDFPGWDHHSGEHPKVEGSALYSKIVTLAEGLSNLNRDMSNDTVVAVMSEFGRTVVGNISLGTDHGRGGAMILMGKKVSRSGINNIPTLWNLRPASFEGENGSRALSVDIDYREILAELLHKHMHIPWNAESTVGAPAIKTIFDGLERYTLRNLVS